MKKYFLLLSFMALSLFNAQAQNIPSYVPANGLVGWWPFNGNANDESGNGNNGTVNGATLTTDRYGNVNQAYGFDGNNDIVLLPADLTSYSIEFWFNFSFATNQFSELFFYEDCSVSIVQNGNYIYARKQNQITSSVEISTAPILNNQWNHCVVIYDNNLNTLSCLINNVNIYNSITAFGGAPNFIDDNQFHVGGRQFNNSNYLNGKIDDIGIWNRTLTECEIHDLYHAQLNSQAVSAGVDQTICSGDNVTLSGSGGGNYLWNNNVVDGQAFTPTQSNAYVLNGTATLGCTGIDTVIVTVLENAASTLTQTALDSYTLNGQTYTQSGTYTQTLIAANGCDSTITLNLTLNFTGIDELGTVAKKLVKITDLNGKIIPRRRNTLMLFIYEDGTVERIVEMEE